MVMALVIILFGVGGSMHLMYSVFRDDFFCSMALSINAQELLCISL